MRQSLAPLNIKSQVLLYDKSLTVLYLSDMSIGARIICLRKAHKPKKLSQEALGELCDVSKSAVSQWESGATEPDIKTLVKLRSKIAFSLDWLLTGEGEIGAVYGADPVIDHVVDAMRHMGKEDAARLAAISDTFKLSQAKPNIAQQPKRFNGEHRQREQSISFPDRRKKPFRYGGNNG